MRRLSVRSRGNGSFEVGPAGRGPTVSIRAKDGRAALKLGKRKLRENGKIAAAGANSYRNTKRICTVPNAEPEVADASIR